MIAERAGPYHAMAEACRSKAARAPIAKDKTEWLNLADAWLKLLHEAAETGKLHARNITKRALPH